MISSSQSPPPPNSRASWGRGRPARLALKELRETLRDRRTLITLVLMPILVYPLLGVILQKALLTSASEAEEIRYSIAFCSPEEANRFKAMFDKGDSASGSEKPPPPLDWYVPEHSGADCRPEKLIADGVVDVVVRFGTAATNDSERPLRSKEKTANIELIYQEDSPHSQAAALAVTRGLSLKPHWRVPANSQPGFDVPESSATELVFNPVKPKPAHAAKFSLATFVPLMLILMTVTGAVYPAIDLTAGERERGTLEVLVAAPVPRMQLLGAKFVAVLTVALLTAVVNLAAMLITLYASGLESLIFGDGGISWGVMGQIFALLMLFAAFFSAVLLALTSFAKSFKEAQAYLIPLMLVALAPGIFSLTPGLKMNGFLAVAPLVNIVLLGRDLFEGRMVPHLFGVAVISTIFYAFLALVLAAKVFGSDAILYGSQGSLKDLLRRPERIRPVPSLTQITFALAVLFPSFVILGGLPARWTGGSVLDLIGLRAAITVLLFTGWPLVMVWRNSVRFRTGFRVGRPSLWAFAVAVLWGLSLWIWVYELKVVTLSEPRLEKLREVFLSIKRELDQVPLGWRLAALAFVPAVCEEWFFRGYLLSGLRARVSPLGAVLISAALFGLFHVIVRDMLFFERFLTSGLMGLMLGWLAVKSGSVWPGMLLHVLHNGLLLLLEAHQTQLMNWGIGMETQRHFPWPWLAGSAFVIGLGIWALTRLAGDELGELDQNPIQAEASKP